jgi:flagellar protein FlaF
MAVAEIIGAAVGVLLLVIVAYLLVGGTITVAETVSTAQKDLTLLQESRMRTSIALSGAVHQVTPLQSNFLNFTVTNNGNEVVTDLSHVDIFSYDTASNEGVHYSYDVTGSGTPGTWFVVLFDKDTIHQQELDPGDVMRVSVALPTDTYIPNSVQMTTSNGVSAIIAV